MRKKEIRQLIKQTEPHKKLLFNRLTYTVIIILLLSTGAQAYIAQNDGKISGTVVDQNNEPVDGATVEMTVIPLSGVTVTESTTTDAQGEFTFIREDVLEFRITIIVDEEEIHTQQHHLLFRGQNTELQIKLNTTID